MLAQKSGLLERARNRFLRVHEPAQPEEPPPAPEPEPPALVAPPPIDPEVKGRNPDAQAIYQGRVIRNDDPLINNWYHTIELAPGLVTGGLFDHRPYIHRMGLPESLKGKTVLDVATGDGFWAFEMERRGADKVVAVDVRTVNDYDLTPAVRAARPEEWFRNDPYPTRFQVAHTIKGSKVDYRKCNVYELGPERVGTFDVVYCGSLLLHVFDPLQALINIRSVTRDYAVIETEGLTPESVPSPDRPWALFGCRGHETPLGEHHIYWHLSERAFCDLLLYAGFSSVEPQGQFWMVGPGGGQCYATPVIARV